MLSSLLETIKDEKKVSLAVADPKLGNAINKLPQFDITPVSDSATADIYRAIREQDVEWRRREHQILVDPILRRAKSVSEKPAWPRE